MGGKKLQYEETQGTTGLTILYEATMSSKAQAAMHLWNELEERRDVKLVR